jgi:hypothetical protein
MATANTRDDEQKLALFRRRFAGRRDVYGTYDLRTGMARQVKQPVTDAVVRAHLLGHQPWGVYLLQDDRTQAAVVDFDFADLEPILDFVRQAWQSGLPAYIERSKSKGHHVWLFFGAPGVKAAKARSVIRRVLAEIRQPGVEVFPKQDRLTAHCRYGNFIYAPLFGRLVPQDRTVFVRAGDPTRPVADQWAFLESVELIRETRLDELIAVNELGAGEPAAAGAQRDPVQTRAFTPQLMPCAQRMLASGVRENQRVACFRLAVHLKRVGLPRDAAEVVLQHWAMKNRPTGGKRIIKPEEIAAQAYDAYSKPYRSFGCEHAAVRPFCDPACRFCSRSTAQRRPGPDKLPNEERKTTMSTASPNRPIRKFRAGRLQLAIWERDGRTRSGQAIKLHRITLNKRYRVKGTDEWKDSNSFFLDDLPRLRLLLDKAYEHLLLANGSVGRDKSPADDTAAH